MKYYQVGKILATFGIKGEVKVLNESDFDRFKKNNILYLKKDNEYIEIKIDSARPHKNAMLIKFNGIDDINKVLKYVGLDIYVKDPEKKAGSYYVDDIIGLDVFDNDNNKIGKVIDILIMPKVNVLQIEEENGNIALVPNVSEFVKEIKMDENKIVIQPIEGMFK